MNDQEIAKILDEIPAQVAWRRPDSIIRESPEWFQVITPSSKLTPLNGIYRTIVSPEKADMAISDAIHDFRNHETPFRWVLTGTTRPTDFATRLEGHNFKRDNEALGLAAQTSEISAHIDSDIKIVELTEDSLDEWVDAAIVGWGNPESFRESIRTDVRRALKEQREILRYFSAIVGTKIVGTGTLRICNKSGHLLGSSVRPEFRGRGIYRALVAERARVAETFGLSLMTTHGMVNTSAPILKKIGFRHFSNMVQYTFSHSP